jgi:hypothetical protein
MGYNFHTPWDATTVFSYPIMNILPAGLDQAITYLKNVMVSCNGAITYNKATGELSWSAPIQIMFNTAAGLSVYNTIAAGSVTLTDGKFFYVDLSETNAATVSPTTATFTGAGTSNFIAYNRLVLAYRNATSDDVYSVALHPQLNDPAKIVQVLTCADNVTIDWSAGHTAEITLDRALTTFAFSGIVSPTARLILIVKQYAGVGAVAFDAEARAGSDLSLPPILSAIADKEDYLGFIYRSSVAKYDFVAFTRGF